MTDQNPMNRRGILKFAALLSSSFALGGAKLNLSSLLEQASTEERVRRIVEKHFPNANLSASTARDFYRSLLAAKDHRESSQFFLEHLSRKELSERLEIYVIEEFCVSTNYLMVAAGEAGEVAMWKV